MLLLKLSEISIQRFSEEFQWLISEEANAMVLYVFFSFIWKNVFWFLIFNFLSIAPLVYFMRKVVPNHAKKPATTFST